MKPVIDLKNPLIASFTKAALERGKQAVDAARALEDSVRPIYAFGSGKRVPHQLGSCVLLNIGEHCFLLTAAHVMEQIGDNPVLVGCGDKLHQLGGERFSSMQGLSGTHQDDSIDAAVFHITSGVPEAVRTSSLSVSDIDTSMPFNSATFVYAGYRASQSSSRNGRSESKLELFPADEFDFSEYERRGIDPRKFVATSCEDHVIRDGHWQKAPRLHGISGGAFFRVPGISMNPFDPPSTPVKPVLAAITMERKKAKDRKQHPAPTSPLN